MQYPPTNQSARIAEIFSSLQGEGTRLGERHIFIRFEECHIHCGYCDELDKPAVSMTLDEVAARVIQLEKEEGPHSFVSLTGGEPLLYVQFLKPLMMKLKAEQFRLYLETNGILHQALEEVIGWCDFIAMDMKPSSVTKEKTFEEEHRAFLRIAKGREAMVKIVLSKEINVAEFERLIQIVAVEAPHVPVVLQPISTQHEGHDDPDLMDILTHLQRMALRRISRVAIMPRFHRILKIR